jgi:hypothetical protein
MKNWFKFASSLLIPLFLAILLLSALISVQLKKKSQLLNQSNSQNSRISELLLASVIKNNIISNLNYKKLNDITIKSLNSNFVSLKDELNFPIFLFRFDPNHSCSPCIDNTLRILNSIGDSIGSERIVLLSKYNSDRDLKLLRMRNSLDFRLYNYNDVWIEDLEKSQLDQIQITFIIDENFRIILPNLSSSDDSISNYYYSKIIDFFKEYHSH